MRPGTDLAYFIKKVYHPTSPANPRRPLVGIPAFYYDRYNYSDIGTQGTGFANFGSRFSNFELPLGYVQYLTAPAEPTVQSLPIVVPTPPLEPPSDIPAEIDRRDQPPPELPDVPPPPPHLMDIWYVTGAETQAELDMLIAAGKTLVPVEDRWGTTAPVVLGTVPEMPIGTGIIAPEETDVSWISDIYDTVDTAVGGWLPGGVPVGSSLPVSMYPPTILPVSTGGGGGGGLPPPVITGPVGGSCGPNDPSAGMVYKKVCGQYKWVKRKGRRRKQLASKGDIKDLSALIGIFGNGKALQTWIATHS